MGYAERGSFSCLVSGALHMGLLTSMFFCVPDYSGDLDHVRYLFRIPTV